MKKVLLCTILLFTALFVRAQENLDTYVPVTDEQASNTFAVIIANEHYEFEVPVPYAINDGAIFKRYLEKTLGVPDKNIRFVPDASLNKMRRNLQWLSDVVSVLPEGEARVIVYYSGHGMPDEASKDAYLLPVDGYSTDPRSGVNTADFYKLISSMKTSQTLVLLDACFSGAKREGGMIQAARGVAIKAKKAPISSENMVVFSAATGDETAWPLKEKEHGLFTYYILQQLNEKNGCVSLGELSDKVTAEVKRVSMLENGKMQTPTITAPAGSTAWRDWKFASEPAKRYESMPKIEAKALAPATATKTEESVGESKPQQKTFIRKRIQSN